MSGHTQGKGRCREIECDAVWAAGGAQRWEERQFWRGQVGRAGARRGAGGMPWSGRAGAPAMGGRERWRTPAGAVAAKGGGKSEIDFFNSLAVRALRTPQQSRAGPRRAWSWFTAGVDLSSSQWKRRIRSVDCLSSPQQAGTGWTRQFPARRL